MGGNACTLRRVVRDTGVRSSGAWSEGPREPGIWMVNSYTTAHRVPSLEGDGVSRALRDGSITQQPGTPWGRGCFTAPSGLSVLMHCSTA
jgi:hypothetical protein